jgi:hypothetical protein
VLAGKNDAVWKKFGDGRPTLIFGSSEQVERPGGTPLAHQAVRRNRTGTRAPKWAENEETATKAAKGARCPRHLHRDDKPKSEQAVPEFSAQPLAELYDKAIWVQKTIDLKSDEAKTLGLSSLPAVWIIDVRIDDAKTRVVKKSSPKGATIKTDLAAILKTWKKDEASKEEPKKE